MERASDRPENPAQPADPVQANDYDSFARAYAAGNENNIQNAYYERPAIVALTADVSGRRILDAAAARAPSSLLCKSAAPTSPASTPAPKCWRWPGSGSVTRRTCTWAT